MRRREFIAGLGSTAALPLAARAQQDGRMRRIGVLMVVGEGDPAAQVKLAAFRQQLAQSGWADGRNLRFEYRWGAGDTALFRKYAAELVGLNPDIFLAQGSGSVGPLLQETGTVPIVFVDTIGPTGGGLVASLARPGANATGFVTIEYSLSGKWMELLKQIAPRVTRGQEETSPASPISTQPSAPSGCNC